ncbi:30S ribosomal protein S16 [Candidatus Gottesmanbacteria bacterium RBG_13_45_10]|uniref:Small ribosomal subunit protein bS16 n=1 Tax=Candidatus Gottesmanbacteria bacterium RBG_13_45_10 TaxID=1798370 RepID=A0A1F5ZGM1_9BACT|nr:MAG: 30S ribosomal protein S16 [Candidatus Gottesmanbacteria bacterium RBG_13_45_10]
MLKIRLAQTGTTNRKSYRVVAIEEGKRRNGRALEILGYYNPLVTPAQISIKKDRVEHWRKQGAQISPAVENLLK